MTNERFISRAGDGVITRRKPTLSIEDMYRIVVELDVGIPPERSKVRQSPEARQFRERAARRMAKAKEHPKYHLGLPEL